MRATAILTVALAVGVALAAAIYLAFDSVGVALGVALVATYFLWGELSDRFGRSRGRKAGDGPLLLDPVRRRRLIGAIAFLEQPR